MTTDFNRETSLPSRPTTERMQSDVVSQNDHGASPGIDSSKSAGLVFTGGYLDELLPALNRLEDETDVLSARDLFLGAAAAEVRAPSAISRFADAYHRSPIRRDLTSADLLQLRIVPKLVKSIFDFYFREDLYGHWRANEPLILSSGSFYGDGFVLPDSLKKSISFAVERDWYGYSDSRGRRETRQALAALTGACFGNEDLFDLSHVAVVMGGTAGISSVVDYLASKRASRGIALCSLPNYPPLIAAIDKRYDVDFGELSLVNGKVDLSSLLEKLDARHSLVMLQTVVNPWGLRIEEDQLIRLIEATPSGCTVILDECHECHGPTVEYSTKTVRSNVIRVNSLSKRCAAPGLKVGWIVADPMFIDGFYEHASSTYGGPPSLFYLLLELFARFEAARKTECKTLRGELHLFSTNYGYSEETLDAAYGNYVQSTKNFGASLLARRKLTVSRLSDGGFGYVAPKYSNNVFAVGGTASTYATYEGLIASSNVSVYPGILCMHGTPGAFRISPCIPISEISLGLDKVIQVHARA